MLCLHDANSVAVGQDNRRAHIATQIRRLSHQLRVSEPAAGILADSAVLNLGNIQMHNRHFCYPEAWRSLFTKSQQLPELLCWRNTSLGQQTHMNLTGDVLIAAYHEMCGEPLLLHQHVCKLQQNGISIPKECNKLLRLLSQTIRHTVTEFALQIDTQAAASVGWSCGWNHMGSLQSCLWDFIRMQLTSIQKRRPHISKLRNVWGQ